MLLKIKSYDMVTFISCWNNSSWWPSKIILLWTRKTLVISSSILLTWSIWIMTMWCKMKWDRHSFLDEWEKLESGGYVKQIFDDFLYFLLQWKKDMKMPLIMTESYVFWIGKKLPRGNLPFAVCLGCQCIFVVLYLTIHWPPIISLPHPLPSTQIFPLPIHFELGIYNVSIVVHPPSTTLHAATWKYFPNA